MTSKLISTTLPPARSLPRRIAIAVTTAAVAALAVTGVGVAPALAATPSETGIFSDTLAPGVAAEDGDRNAVELGVRFTPTQSGVVTDLQYYQGRNAGPVTTATLWSSSGAVLGRAEFSPTTQVGWRTVPLERPVPLTLGRTYTASYLAPQGRYPVLEHNLSSSREQNGFQLAADAGVYHYGSTSAMPRDTWEGSNYLVDVVYEPVDAAAPAPSQPAPAPSQPAPAPSQPAPAPSQPAPAPSQPAPAPSVPPTTPPASGGIVELGRTFPSEKTTGVPAGTTLQRYTGPCTIQTPNTVIDAKLVDCSLRILAHGVQITRSQINGSVYADANAGNGSFTITDSWINMGNWEGTGIGDANFTATRVHVTGGSRSVNCYLNCTVQDSYVHGQFTDTNGRAHESGIRMGSGSVLRGNTIGCTAPDVAPDAGCSAALTGYGDFDIVQKNTIDGNLILAGSGGYCSYGGSTSGKPYSAGVNNIKFTNNVWQKGESGQCGFWGPITSFDSNAPGNVWSNNLYDDGKAVPPAN
jgi:hypothetical protein